jgi:hypothetical protein
MVEDMRSEVGGESEEIFELTRLRRRFRGTKAGPALDFHNKCWRRIIIMRN